MLFAVSPIVCLSFVPLCSHFCPPAGPTGLGSPLLVLSLLLLCGNHQGRVLGDFLVLTFRFGWQAVIWKPASDLPRLRALTLRAGPSCVRG